MTKQVIALNDLDIKLLKGERRWRFITMITLTLVFFLFILIDVFFELDDFWIKLTVGASLMFNGLFIYQYYKYGKDLRHGSKLLICGTLTNKQWFWGYCSTRSFYTVDNDAFEYEPIDMKQSDNVELRQPIEIHWLMHSHKMLYVKKGAGHHNSQNH